MGKLSVTMGRWGKTAAGQEKEAARIAKKIIDLPPGEERDFMENKLKDMQKRSYGAKKAVDKDMDDAVDEWLKNTPPDELKDILGAPKPDSEGVVMHRKKGGPIGVGIAKRGFGAVRKK